MKFELSIYQNSGLIQEQATKEVLQCNDVTAGFGLTLTENAAVALVETRAQALKKTGRIEFGGGVIDKIIYAFCDSPYMTTQNYEDTLHDLLEIFYYYKNETLDAISDDALIKFMKESFNGICQGSLELLSDRELARFARNLRFGRSPNDADEPAANDEEMEDE